MSIVPALDFRRQGDTGAEAVDSFDAEAALLGAVLFDNSALERCGDLVTGAHFNDPLAGWLFDRAREMIARGQVVDAVSLNAAAQGYGTAYEDAGGIRALGNLIANAPPAENAPEYARIVYDCHVRRRVLEACHAGAAEATRDLDRPAFEIASKLRTQLERLEQAAAPAEATMIDAPVAAEAAFAAMEERARTGKVRGLRTGIRCFDRRLGGLQPGALLIIGARPSMGKTALARAGLHGAAVLNPDYLFPFFGLEMGPEEMMQRELSALTYEHGEAVAYQSMQDGTLTPMDLQEIAWAKSRVPPNLILDDCASLSVEDFRRKLWGLRRRGKIGAAVIDYLQLMEKPAGRRGQNDAAILGEMTRTLKNIARQLGICIILLSQLSRAVETRDDKRPVLSDLRESGSIEQDADAVLFPYREVYYLERAEPKEGTTEHLEWEMRCQDLRTRLDVICGKRRQGPVGTDRQRFIPEYDTVQDVSDQS